MSPSTLARTIGAIALTLSTARPAVAQKRPLSGFDAYVAKAVRDWHVPGLAIAIVKDDSVVFAKGYGVRTIGKPDRVDTHTMFANASTTKAFTAMALAMLVDNGKVHWDDPVTKYLPTFQMYDPYVTREFTVRDLLAHRSGLGDDDLLWFASPNTFADILHRLRFLKPVSSFRSRYNYQNIMYATAGHVVEAASGMPWQDFIRTRILDPLGMTETVTDVEGLRGRTDVATPHDVIDDTLRAIAYRNLDNIAPAGGMNSSVSDMTKWLRFLLDSGQVNGAHLVTTSSFAEMFTPQTIIRESDFYPTAPLTHAHFTAYGMGWFLEDYRGRKVEMHTGSIDGMSAIVGLLPEEHLGLVVFENEDHAELRHALMWAVFDRYLHAPPTDWSDTLRAMSDSATARRKAAERKVEQSRVAGTHPSLALERYAGTYADSSYGTVSVRLEHDTLVASFGPYFTGKLEHWNYDTFRARWTDRELGTTFLTFSLGVDGAVKSVRLSGVGDFGRVPDTVGAAK